MSTTALDPVVARAAGPAGLAFGVCALGLVIGAAAVSGLMPIQFSIISVFLCAGPHNWVEARYFLSRLPARWGRLQAYFLFGFAGVFALTAAFAGLPYLLIALDAGAEIGLSSYALWNTLFVLWIATLVQLRSGQNPAPRLGLGLAGGVRRHRPGMDSATAVGPESGLRAPADRAVDSRPRNPPHPA